MRRLRQSDAMRALVRETRLAPDMFMLPLFVCEGEGIRREIGSMPGVFNLSVDEAVKEVEGARGDGFAASCSSACPVGRRRVGRDRSGRAVRTPSGPSNARCPTCSSRRTSACASTDHGHCGIIVDNEVANDPTVEQLVRAAVSMPRPAPTSWRRPT
jgi:porphobilinogen synthase